MININLERTDRLEYNPKIYKNEGEEIATTFIRNEFCERRSSRGWRRQGLVQTKKAKSDKKMKQQDMTCADK